MCPSRPPVLFSLGKRQKRLQLALFRTNTVIGRSAFTKRTPARPKQAKAPPFFLCMRFSTYDNNVYTKNAFLLLTSLPQLRTTSYRCCFLRSIHIPTGETLLDERVWLSICKTLESQTVETCESQTFRRVGLTSCYMERSG